jgi:acetoin utilization protein AcuB
MKWKIRVEEYTTPYPITVNEELSIDELNQLMQTHDVRHLPVMRDGAVVGVISDRDLRLASGLSEQHKIQIRAGDLMTTDPITVSADTLLDEVAIKMADLKIGSVIVNDENGDLLGIFTVSDALEALIEISSSDQV